MLDEVTQKREKAEHYRELATRLTDQQVVSGLIELAEKLEREVEELEQHPQTVR